MESFKSHALTHLMRTAFASAAAICVATAAHAQSGTVSLGDKPDAGTEIRLGALIWDLPQYPGADKSHLQVWPSFAAYSANGWFVTVANGVGWNFCNGKTVDCGARLTYDMGRDANDSPRLRGMSDVKPRVEVGGFFNYDFTRNLTLKSAVRYGNGNDSDGALLDVALNFGFPIIENTYGVLGVSTAYANASYMRSYFGVTPAQSAASGYPAYSPGASVRDAAINVAVYTNVFKDWTAFAKLGFTRLEGDARLSPISFKPNYTSLMMGASYKFAN